VKIVLACRHINNMSGGVERVICWLANSLTERGFDVTLLTWDRKGGKPFYDLHPQVKLEYVDLGDPYKAASFSLKIKRFIKIRRIIGKIEPNVVVGFQIATLVPLWFSILFRRTKLILTERNSLQYLKMTEGLLRSRLLPFLYSLADLTVVQFEEFKSFYPSIVHLDVIHNPVFERPPRKLTKQNIILSVGRLSYQKNFELLIGAFNLIKAKIPDWKLVILGGGQETEIHRLLELNPERIEICPPTQDVDSYYQCAEIFCLPSRWEGFPNALAEALASSLPSVGFASCDGVNILIKDGFNGFLAEERTVEALAEKLIQLCKDENLRRSMGDSSLRIIKTYSPDDVFEKWVQTLYRVLN